MPHTFRDGDCISDNGEFYNAIRYIGQREGGGCEGGDKGGTPWKDRSCDDYLA